MGGGGTQGFGIGGNGVVNGTFHEPVLLFCGPVRMVWFPIVTLTWSDVKLTLHP